MAPNPKPPRACCAKRRGVARFVAASSDGTLTTLDAAKIMREAAETIARANAQIGKT